jgi:hypothetical protein
MGVFRVFLGPVNRLTPFRSFQLAPASTCPVAVSDVISVTLTNPQSGSY